MVCVIVSLDELAVVERLFKVIDIYFRKTFFGSDVSSFNLALKYQIVNDFDMLLLLCSLGLIYFDLAVKLFIFEGRIIEIRYVRPKIMLRLFYANSYLTWTRKM